jgi:ornithine cyclodeaminase/alanine dehydrogenase-like protein (mu-crystallin family)
LSDLVSDRAARSRPSAVTLFKSVGTALEDLVAAELATGGVVRDDPPRS